MKDILLAFLVALAFFMGLALTHNVNADTLQPSNNFKQVKGYYHV